MQTFEEKLIILKEELTNDESFYIKINDYFFQCKVTCIYQSEENKNLIISYAVHEILNILKNFERAQKAKQELFKFTKKEKQRLEDSLFKNLRNLCADELAEPFLDNWLGVDSSSDYFSNCRQSFMKIANKVVSLSKINNDEGLEILSILACTFELREKILQYRRSGSNPSDILFFVRFALLLTFFYLCFYQSDIFSINTAAHNNQTNERYIFSRIMFNGYYIFFSEILLKFIEYTGDTLTKRFLPLEENVKKERWKIFDVDAFIMTAIKYPLTVKKPIEELPIDRPEKQEDNITVSSKSLTETEDSPPIQLVKVKKKRSYYFFKKKLPKKVIAEQNIIFSHNTLDAYIIAPIKSIHMLKKAVSTTPLAEGKFYIYFDNSETPTEHIQSFAGIAKDATFYPGSARDKKCVHFLGNDIWSLKDPTKNYRILGTAIAKATVHNKQIQLIYFWKIVNHSQQKKLLEAPNKLRKTLEEPPRLVRNYEEEALTRGPRFP